MDARIKIFVDAHCFDTEYQGTRTFIKGIYTMLAQKSNLSLFLAAYDVGHLKQQFPNKSNITFIKYKSRSRFFRLAVDIPRIIKKHKIQYAHFQYIAPFTKSCKHIVTLHDVLFEEYPHAFPFFYKLTKKILFKRSALSADILTTVSAYSKKSIHKYFSIPFNRVHVVPNGVDALYFGHYDKAAAKAYIKKHFDCDKYILYVSRFEPRKNHLALLNAFLQLRLYEKNYHLVLLGHASISVPEFTRKLNALPQELRKYILIADKIGNKQLLFFYRAADVFMYPSLAEGFGIPALEAGAVGTPVICSNKTALSDFHFFSKNHVDPTDEFLLQNRLADLLQNGQDAELLKKISNKIKNNYSWLVAAEKLYQLILNDVEQTKISTSIKIKFSNQAKVLAREQMSNHK